MEEEDYKIKYSAIIPKIKKLKRKGKTNNVIALEVNESVYLVGLLLRFFMKDYDKYKYKKIKYRKVNNKKIALGNPFHKNIDYNSEKPRIK